jgi:AcrR family transcriptional regulator
MPMPKLSPTRKQLVDAMMKEAVYEAAVSVLLEYGVEGMTVDRVAAATQVAKATLYNYFPNKRALFHFILVRTISPVLTALETIATSDRPVQEKLEQQLRTFVDDAAHRMTLLTFLLRDETVRGLIHSSDWEAREVAIRHIATVFRQGIAAGVFRPMDAAGQARMFFGAWTEVLDHSLHTGEMGDKDSTVRMILDTFLHGVVADASSVSPVAHQVCEESKP